MFMSSASMRDLSFVKMTAILSSGRRRTSLDLKFFSGTVRVTLTGMREGGGRWSVRYLHRGKERACEPQGYYLHALHTDHYGISPSFI